MIQRLNARYCVQLVVPLVLTAIFLTAPAFVAQASAQAAPTAATVDDAKPFLGVWTTTFDSPQGPITFDIEVHLDKGDPGATVSNSLLGESEVEDVTKSGASLVLKYLAEVQGMQIPITMSLAPDGETLKVNISVLDGQFTTSSVATRKK